MSQKDYDFLVSIGRLGLLREAPVPYEPKKHGLFRWWLREQDTNFQKVHNTLAKELPDLVQFRHFVDASTISYIVELTDIGYSNCIGTVPLQTFEPDDEGVPF
jgi:hypothetical protein